MSPIEAATDDLQALAVLWSIGEAHAHDVVEAACAALVAGLDSPALRILAGYTRAEAEYGVPDLLPFLVDELDLVFYTRDSEAGQEAVVRALAHRMLAGRLPHRAARAFHPPGGVLVGGGEPLTARSTQGSALVRPECRAGLGR
ncbi:hypothetical protein ACFW4O_11465 [Streptomyces mutabilis]|uniref:hypothetical protein n=1 Tax=Streptomyces TaxID=1883 RepID=UPI0036C0112E